MKRYRSLSVIVIISILLSALFPAPPARACTTQCDECCYWNGYECVDGSCSGCCDCIGCSCTDDDSECTGSCTCSNCSCCGTNVCCDGTCCSAGQTCCNGTCCDSGDCCGGDTCCTTGDTCCTDSGSYCCCSDETCCGGGCCGSSQTCCGGDTCCTTGDTCCTDSGNYCCGSDETCCDGSCCSSSKCCDGGVCVDRCDPNGGEMCTYEFPPVVDPLCSYLEPGNTWCKNPGMFCGWEELESPEKNAKCADCDPDCDRVTTYCAKLKPVMCEDVFIWFPPFHDCRCEGEPEGTYTPEYPGQKYECE